MKEVKQSLQHMAQRALEQAEWAERAAAKMSREAAEYIEAAGKNRREAAEYQRLADAQPE